MYTIVTERLTYSYEHDECTSCLQTIGKYIFVLPHDIRPNAGAVEAAGVRVSEHPHFLDSGCPI